MVNDHPDSQSAYRPPSVEDGEDDDSDRDSFHPLPFEPGSPPLDATPVAEDTSRGQRAHKRRPRQRHPYVHFRDRHSTNGCTREHAHFLATDEQEEESITRVQDEAYKSTEVAAKTRKIQEDRAQ